MRPGFDLHSDLNGILSALFFASIFGIVFSNTFQNIDDLWLPLWLPFGSLWRQFCTPFSDLFFDVIFPRFPSISRALILRKPLFYCSKTMVFAKPPNLNNLQKTFDFLSLFDLVFGALWLPI